MISLTMNSLSVLALHWLERLGLYEKYLSTSLFQGENTQPVEYLTKSGIKLIHSLRLP